MPPDRNALCASQRAEIGLDWSDAEYSKDGTNAFHCFFRSPVCDPIDVVPTSDSAYPDIWRGRLHESAWNMRARFGSSNDRQTWRNFSIDPGRLEYAEDVLVVWTYKEQIDLLRPHIQARWKEFGQLSNKDILKTLLRENLTLQPEIRERVDRFKSLHFRGAAVGIHVRYSDYRTRLWAALQKVNSILEAAPDARIFLSTDNARVKRMIEEHYPAAASTAHWYPPMPGVAIHTHRHRPSPMESGIEALVDLYLPAECTHLVIDTSSSLRTHAGIGHVFVGLSGSVKTIGGPRARSTPRLGHRALSSG